MYPGRQKQKGEVILYSYYATLECAKFHDLTDTFKGWWKTEKGLKSQKSA